MDEEQRCVNCGGELENHRIDEHAEDADLCGEEWMSDCVTCGRTTHHNDTLQWGEAD